jgi:hypothetical protein
VIAKFNKKCTATINQKRVYGIPVIPVARRPMVLVMVKR